MDNNNEISDLWCYGIDISVENCKVEDLLYSCFSTKEGSISNSAFIRTAEIIKAACWFEGKWCIKMNGRLVRCDVSMKIESFFNIKIKPVDSESNISALLYFKEMQDNGNYEEKDFSVSMSLFTIKVDENGFYLPQIRHDFDLEHLKSAFC